jgi:hypothetical protein
VPAAPVRTVCAEIDDVEDRKIRVCVVTFPDHPEWPAQIEIGNYIPSTNTYTRGFMFDEGHRAKVVAGIRAAGRAQ